MTADVKAPRRIVDKACIAKFHRLELRCLFCNDQPTDPHHIYPKGRGGDDVMANLLPLCRRCHDAAHGTPYTRVVPEYNGAVTVRVEGSAVRGKIGRWLYSNDGMEARAYLFEKLGVDPAKAFMRREYGVRL